jgi:hypothetical protein
MTKVVLMAQVKNIDAWEKAFRTHGDLFKSQGQAISPISYTKTGNEVVLCSEVADVNTYRKMVNSPETIAAMEQDGVKRETLRVFELDKELRF